MPQTITAVYEHGILQPLVPLNLQEHQRVQIQIVPEVKMDKPDAVIQFLRQLGILSPPNRMTHGEPISLTERQKLSKRLGQAVSKPLSEMIIEERGER